ncbi:hypothetical protein FV227_14045 [Methylobacterium sp. WL119]|uniref:hypothetical protein n=1 Tax=unclassified Methylobacterium TaxID=2615210 RepID=UPI0011CADEAB|nr:MULTISPECIES: hypothetical protein [unclassified Methylobacterium]TXN40674.1 hypothetical protein FV225_05360 [Methylobacterium sp. WL93]TXN49998.1 hypothetical protein FV227_14045 [Methylobacterium sp. WL119]
MSRRPVSYSYKPAPPNLLPVFEAVAEAAAQAEVYARAAADFAAIGDARGLGYSLRSAAACLMTASGLADELRPSRQAGERAA